MPSTNNRALLMNLEVFLADNNIRRGILSAAANVQSVTNNFVEQTLDVAPNSTNSFTCALTSQCLVIRVTKPVNVVMTRGEESLSFTINSLFVFTDTSDLLEFTNLSLTEISTVKLIQL